MFERKQIYLCREEATEKRVHGTLQISDVEMKLSLASFDDFFFIQNRESVPVRLENSSYATLLNCIFGGPGRTHAGGKEQITTYNQTIIPNTVVTGPDPWELDRPVKHVQFGVPDASVLLIHSPKFKELARADFEELPDMVMSTIELETMTVRVWYAISEKPFDRTSRIITPKIDLDLNSPKNVETYWHEVMSIVRFLSSILCLPLRPDRTEIHSESSVEQIAQIKAGASSPAHEVHYHSSQEGVLSEVGNDLHAAYALVYDDEEKAFFERCLGAWIERDSKWVNATAAMMVSFRLSDEISGERLMSAFQWLEEIPTAAPQKSIADDHVRQITDAAVREASSLGLNNGSDRIRGALSVLQMESHRDRFTRLLDTIYKEFGRDILDHDIVDYLILATQFRGRVAHGVFEPRTADESRKFRTAIFAVETLCYLLTVRDLPLSAGGRERVRHCRPISGYLNSHVPSG